MKKNDNFEVREYDPNVDYDMVAEWWGKLPEGGWEPPPKNLLENGFIIDNYCAAFLHIMRTTSGLPNFGYLHPIISNAESNIMKRDRALDFLLKSVTEHAENSDCNFIYTTCSTPALIKRLNKRHNMFIAEDNITSLILPLGCQDNISYDSLSDPSLFPESE